MTRRFLDAVSVTVRAEGCRGGCPCGSVPAGIEPAGMAGPPGEVKHACLRCPDRRPRLPWFRSGAGLSAGAWHGREAPEPPLTCCECGDGNARNLDGTPSSCERVSAVKRQVSGLLCGEGGPSVKPSAKPTLVRTQHLPPPAEIACELGFPGLAGCCFWPGEVPLSPSESRCV